MSAFLRHNGKRELSIKQHKLPAQDAWSADINQCMYCALHRSIFALALVLRVDLAVGVDFFSCGRVGIVFVAVIVGRTSSTISLPLTLFELAFELAEIRRSPDTAGLTSRDWPTSNNTLQPF